MASVDLSEFLILVVEDDPDARDLMQAVLEQRGARVIAAGSASAAVALFVSTRVDVVVSDIAMPEEDGVAFVMRLRAFSPEQGGRTPAIAVSAYVGGSDRARALGAGFDRYLHKPVDFDQLASAILTLTRR